MEARLVIEPKLAAISAFRATKNDLDNIVNLWRTKDKRVKYNNLYQNPGLYIEVDAIIDKLEITHRIGSKQPLKGYFLRIEGNEVVTTGGARVPVKEAKILLARIRAGKDIKGFKIGFYTVISINGTLKIGCHEFEKSEIDTFTKFYNW